MANILSLASALHDEAACDEALKNGGEHAYLAALLAQPALQRSDQQAKVFGERGCARRAGTGHCIVHAGDIGMYEDKL